MNKTTGLVIAGVGLAATLVGGVVEVAIKANTSSSESERRAEFVEPHTSVAVPSSKPSTSPASTPKPTADAVDSLVTMVCKVEDDCTAKLDYHDHGWWVTIEDNFGTSHTIRLTK